MIGIKDREATWTVAELWNTILDRVDEYPPTPRNYLWASELGLSDIDIYLRLNGVEPSNKSDSRAKRKFDAGIQWEWVAATVFRRLGLLIERERPIKYQTKNYLPVSGRADLVVGGQIDEDMVTQITRALSQVDFPEHYTKAMAEMLKVIKAEFGVKTFKTRILEVKSASAFMYDAQYKYGEPSMNHALQCFHYVNGSDTDEGAVFYISKDDSRLSEIPIWKDDEVLRKAYEDKLARITEAYETQTQPDREKLVIWDEDKGKFSDNWNIKYSSYLTYLYGFNHESEYTDAFKSKIASWNRVVGRIKRGDNMTKSNLEYIEEIKKEFPNFDELVANSRQEEVEEEPAEMEQD